MSLMIKVYDIAANHNISAQLKYSENELHRNTKALYSETETNAIHPQPWEIKCNDKIVKIKR